jgi:hypothetical protein
MIFAMIVTIGSNWFLPGIYSLAYEICSCTSQDYSQPRKFENTTMTILLTALLVWFFLAIRIKIYKHSLKVTVAPLVPSQTLATQFQKKLWADKTLTIGSVLFLAMTFCAIYMFSSTNARVDLNVLKYIYVIIMPVAFSLFSIVFYANNVQIRKTLLRELLDSLHTFIECNQ